MTKADQILQSMTRRLTGRRISGGLITLSSAAIFAVYAAGYEQTKAAADRFEQQSAQRLASFPIPVISEETAASPELDASGLNQPPKTESIGVRPAVAVSTKDAVAVRPDVEPPPRCVEFYRHCKCRVCIHTGGHHGDPLVETNRGHSNP
jgi:NAD(P)-dependent dehydrogenase (short-subunit alcohol dehydrogenase family)